jgi:hypothetical protein
VNRNRRGDDRGGSGEKGGKEVEGKREVRVEGEQ